MTPEKFQIDIAKKAADMIGNKGIAYFAMETRTGKTLTSFLTVQNLGYKNALFVTKKKAIPDIIGQRNYWGDICGLDFELDVINYESLHKIQKQYQIIISDEAHNLGAFPKPTGKTKKFKAKVLNKPILYLSATPSPETYSQLYHQMWCSDFGIWKEYKNFYRWAHDYVDKYTIRGPGGREIVQYDRCKEQAIIDFAQIRFEKKQSECGFMQKVNEKIHFVEMQSKISEFIKKIAKHGIIRGKTDDIIADTPASRLTKIRQLSSGTVIGENETHIIDNSKANYIIDNFCSCEKPKFAIYYMYKAERDMLLKAFAENNIKATEISAEFQNNEDVSVFISQFTSGREGVNLSKAEHIVFFNIDYSFLSYEQARNRMQARDRTKPAILHWLFNNSELAIEPKILKVVKSKQKYTTSHYNKDYH